MKLMSRAVPATYFSITTIYIHFLFIKNAYYNSGCFFVSRDSYVQITSFSMNLFLLYATLVTVISMNTTAEYDTHRESN